MGCDNVRSAIMSKIKATKEHRLIKRRARGQSGVGAATYLHDILGCHKGVRRGAEERHNDLIECAYVHDVVWSMCAVVQCVCGAERAGRED
jgi:hypothetical protein